MRIPNPFNRKSPLQRFLDSLDDSLGAAGDLTSSLPSGVRSSKAAKVGLVAASGVAGLTAASAGISTVRRHLEGTHDAS
jgi:hypothetical protein